MSAGSFFFNNVEWRNSDQSGLTTIARENAAAINARLAATGYPGPLVRTGVFATQRAQRLVESRQPRSGIRL